MQTHEKILPYYSMKLLIMETAEQKVSGGETCHLIITFQCVELELNSNGISLHWFYELELVLSVKHSCSTVDVFMRSFEIYQVINSNNCNISEIE